MAKLVNFKNCDSTSNKFSKILRIFDEVDAPESRGSSANTK